MLLVYILRILLKPNTPIAVPGKSLVRLHLSKLEVQVYLKHHELWIYKKPLDILEDDDHTSNGWRTDLKTLSQKSRRMLSRPEWQGPSQRKDRKSLAVWSNRILFELCTNVLWISSLWLPSCLPALFFKGCTCGIWTFPSQVLNVNHSCDLCRSCGNAGSCTSTATWATAVRFFFFFILFRAAPIAYGSSQARGQMGAAAASLCYSHSDTRSKWQLWPSLQVYSKARSLTHWVRLALKPASSRTLVSS